MPSNRIVFAVIARWAEPAAAIQKEGSATPPAARRPDPIRSRSARDAGLTTRLTVARGKAIDRVSTKSDPFNDDAFDHYPSALGQRGACLAGHERRRAGARRGGRDLAGHDRRGAACLSRTPGRG